MVGHGQSRAGWARLCALLRLGLHDSLADSAEHVCHPGNLLTVTRFLLHALSAPLHVTDEDLVLPSLLSHPLLDIHLFLHTLPEINYNRRTRPPVFNTSTQNTNGTYQ